MYADYVASGRSLGFIEDYIREEVLPLYGNTHTTASATGLQSTLFRAEARAIVHRGVGGSKDDVVLFAGSGSTAAQMLLCRVLGLQSWRGSTAQTASPPVAPVVFVGPFEHHSNLLPWREAGCTVVTIPLLAPAHIGSHRTVQLDLLELERQLVHFADRSFKLGSFSAASNVTGIYFSCDTVNAITALLHRHGALSCWDYASAGPYMDIAMNPMPPAEASSEVNSVSRAGSEIRGSRQLYAKDAIILSPHKFIGGVSTPGVLVIKRSLLTNRVPAAPGGGTVFFVSDHGHRYLENHEEREEGGTPDIVGAVRCGLVFQLKEAVGTATIRARERAYATQALQSLGANPRIVLLGPVDCDRLPIISFLIKPSAVKGGKACVTILNSLGCVDLSPCVSQACFSTTTSFARC